MPANLTSYELTKIREIHGFLLDNLNRNYTNKQLVKQFNVSPYFIRKRFPLAFSNTSLKQLLLNKRMQVAAALLLSNDENTRAVKNVAKAVAYKSTEAFSRAFFEHYKVYPALYADHIHKNNIGQKDH